MTDQHQPQPPFQPAAASPAYATAPPPQQTPGGGWFRRHLAVVIVGACALVLVLLLGLVGVVALALNVGAGSPDHAELSKVDPSEFRVIDAEAWNAILKDPEPAEGERIVIYASIGQFDTATGDDTFLGGVGTYQPAQDYEFEMDTMFRGTSGLLADFAENDVVRIHGQVAGAQEYDTLLGGQNVVPLIDIARIENVGFADLASDVKIGRTVRGEYGETTVELTVTNSATKPMSYSIELSATTAGGSKAVGRAYANTPKIAPGASLQIDADGFFDLPKGADISIADINRNNY